MFNRKKVIVTREYIISPHFNEYHRQFGVQKLRLKEGVDKSSIVLDSINGTYFPVDSFEVESDFVYYGGIWDWDESWKERKIYFNRHNEGLIWRDSNQDEISDTAIGNLEYGCWYRFHRIYSNNVSSLICYVGESGHLRTFVITHY